MKTTALLMVACAALLPVGCGSASRTAPRAQTTPAQQRVDNKIVSMLMHTSAARQLCHPLPGPAVFDYRLVQGLVLRDLGAKIREAGGRPYAVAVLFTAECQLHAIRVPPRG